MPQDGRISTQDSPVCVYDFIIGYFLKFSLVGDGDKKWEWIKSCWNFKIAWWYIVIVSDEERDSRLYRPIAWSSVKESMATEKIARDASD